MSRYVQSVVLTIHIVYIKQELEFLRRRAFRQHPESIHKFPALYAATFVRVKKIEETFREKRLKSESFQNNFTQYLGFFYNLI